MRKLVRTAGERMELLEYLTATASKTFRLYSGTNTSNPSSFLLKLAYGMANRWTCSDFLKERLFGLSNPQGNHGESLKEAHFHLDNTPTHSYMKYLYKYPQHKFPYEKLVEENGKRSRDVPEYTIMDTGIFKYVLLWISLALSLMHVSQG